MASSTHRFTPWTFSTLLLTACFNPSPSGLETDTDTTECSPGDTRNCTCDGAIIGSQTCDDAGNFGACVCDEPTTTTESEPTADTSTGDPECTMESDCADMATECQVATCEGGMCVVTNVEAGTACGDATEQPCNLADTCDGQGACQDNVVPDGSTCEGCDADVCVCNAQACEPCNTFAPLNEFRTPRGVDGWELTGGWALRAYFPESYARDGSPFAGQVLGTDGNRTTPYPGAEIESSYARTRATILPDTLEMMSWHLDEGGLPGIQPAAFDNKRIRVSTDDGLTWTTLADCSDLALSPPPFCDLRLDDRAPDDWDPVSIPVPPELRGLAAIVEFSYDSIDDCCGGEQGWYLDDLNFATECACTFDESCEAFGGECGAAVCGATGACEALPETANTPCGDPTMSACNGADRCNGAGQCLPQEVQSFVNGCVDCPSGTCSVCEAGTCNDCVLGTNDFAGPVATQGWTIEALDPIEPAGWGLYSVIPRSAIVDPAMPAMSLLSTAPVLGVDGIRNPPYPGAHVESSRIVSPMALLPAVLTFDSWHQDEGGTNAPMFYDNKIIEASVDGGMTWEVLIDCSTEDPVMPAHPFCGEQAGPRAMDDWDPIDIDLGPQGGQMGQLRLTYLTVDDCCTFERGWYIDNLNFAQFCG
ncbi:MAG: hypothetical protein AAGF11_54355 [Myxococcota bacterium]